MLELEAVATVIDMHVENFHIMTGRASLAALYLGRTRLWGL